MPPPINYFNNNQSLNYTMQPQSSSSTNNGQAQKRSNTILDDYYQKTNKARAIVPKTGNSPLFKPLIPKQQVSSAPAVALNKALENVSLKDTTAAVQESSVVGMKIITGSIDKLFKIHNLHSNIHALYEIFAKIIKITNGKNGEKLFLLRNDHGPVLQGVYYEIDRQLPLDLIAGNSIRVIGRLIGCNRLQIYKLSKMYELPSKLITRLETITTFALNKDKESHL